MKKTILFAGAALMLLATACSGSKNGKDDTTVGVVVDESTEIVVTEDTLANGQVVGDTAAVEAGTIEAGVVTAKEKGKEALNEVKEKGKEAVDASKEKGKEALDAAKQSAKEAVNKTADKLLK